MRFEKSPVVARAVLYVVIAMSMLLFVAVGYRAGHKEPRTQVEPCALVLSRESGPTCR